MQPSKYLYIYAQHLETLRQRLSSRPARSYFQSHPHDHSHRPSETTWGYHRGRPSCGFHKRCGICHTSQRKFTLRTASTVPWLEYLLLLPLLVRRATKLNQLGKQQTHIAPLVHDGSATERAIDLGGRLVLPSLMGRRVEGQIAGALIEPHIFLVEDRTPLEGSAVHDLTPATVAELGVQRLVAFQRVSHLPTLAVGAPLDLAALVQVLDLVRRTVLPCFAVEGLLVADVGECWRWQRVSDREGAHLGYDTRERS